MRRREATDDWDSERAITLVEAQSGIRLTVRQLQAWHHRKAVVASRRGPNNKRFYDFRGIRQLCIVARLISFGLPSNRIRNAIQGVESAAVRIGRPWDELRIVTDGETVFVVDGDRAIEATTGQTASLILLGPLDRETKKICESARRKSDAA